MFKCKNCGAKLRDGTKTCPYCGASFVGEVSFGNITRVQRPVENRHICPTCGKALPYGAQVCPYCGTLTTEPTGNYKTRVQEYAGTIIKCPACGEELPSFTAICPACGHEINSEHISSTIRDFTSQMNRCDIAIANSSAMPKQGWKSWGGWKRFGWVLLNIYTFFVPLLLYFLLPMLGIIKMSGLTPEEKTKAQVVRNYSFPNDRETILEALLYIEAQMESLISGKIDRNTIRWIEIWKNKAAQLYKKAEIMFKNDKIANDAYSSILSIEKKAKHSLSIRVVIAAVVVIIYSIFMFPRSGFGRSLIEANRKYEWPTSGIAMQIPAPSSNKGEITYNDDERFWLRVNGIDQSKYESYVNACIEKGFTIDSEKSSSSYKAFNADGYRLWLIHYESSSELSIDVDAPEPMSEIKWPRSPIARRLPVPKSSYGNIRWEGGYGFLIYLGNTTKQDYQDYVEACIDAGFVNNYDKSDKHYWGDDSDGYSISIEYEGCNVMSVRIEEPDEPIDDEEE